MLSFLLLNINSTSPPDRALKMAAAAAGGGVEAENKEIEELATKFTLSQLEGSTPIPIPAQEKRELEQLSAEVKRVLEAQKKWIQDARGVDDLGPWRMSEEEKAACAGHTTAVKNARQARADLTKRIPGQPGFLPLVMAAAQDHVSETMGMELTPEQYNVFAVVVRQVVNEHVHGQVRHAAPTLNFIPIVCPVYHL